VLSSCFHELQTQEVDSVNLFGTVSGAKKGEFVTELECSLSMGMSAADTSPLNSFNHDLRVSGILYLRGVVCVVVVTGAGDYVVVFPAHNYHPPRLATEMGSEIQGIISFWHSEKESR